MVSVIQGLENRSSHKLSLDVTKVYRLAVRALCGDSLTLNLVSSACTIPPHCFVDLSEIGVLLPLYTTEVFG